MIMQSSKVFKVPSVAPNQSRCVPCSRCIVRCAFLRRPFSRVRLFAQKWFVLLICMQTMHIFVHNARAANSTVRTYLNGAIKKKKERNGTRDTFVSAILQITKQIRFVCTIVSTTRRFKVTKNIELHLLFKIAFTVYQRVKPIEEIYFRNNNKYFFLRSAISDGIIGSTPAFLILSRSLLIGFEIHSCWETFTRDVWDFLAPFYFVRERSFSSRTTHFLD